VSIYTALVLDAVRRGESSCCHNIGAVDYENCCAPEALRKLKTQNTFSAGALPLTPLGELTTLPQTP